MPVRVCINRKPPSGLTIVAQPTIRTLKWPHHHDARLPAIDARLRQCDIFLPALLSPTSTSLHSISLLSHVLAFPVTHRLFASLHDFTFENFHSAKNTSLPVGSASAKNSTSPTPLTLCKHLPRWIP